MDICGGGGGGGGSTDLSLAPVLAFGNDAQGQDISGVGGIFMDGPLHNVNGDIQTGGNLSVSGVVEFGSNVNITGELNCYDPLTIFHNPALGPGDSNPTLNFTTPTQGTSYVQMNEGDGTL